MGVNFDVNKALEKIAEGLHVAVEKVYPVLYKQAIISGVMDVAWILLMAAVVVSYVKFVKFSVTKVNSEIRDRYNVDWFDYPQYLFPIIMGAIVSTGLTVGIFSLSQDAITAFFNTDYYIVKDIFSKLNGK